MGNVKFGWMAVVFLGIALPALAVPQYEITSCETDDFDLKFVNLTANEPAIQKAFDKMAQLSGSSRMNTCQFMVPIENGVTIKNAPRRFQFDKTWHVIQTVAGLQKEVFQHHGITVDYVIRERQLSSGDVAVSRDVVSFSVCRTPASCGRLGFQIEK